MPLILATQADLPEIATLVNAAYRGPEAAKGWTSEAEMIGAVHEHRVRVRHVESAFDDQRGPCGRALCRRPAGGLSFWARLPAGTATEFAQVALLHGVTVVAGPATVVGGAVTTTGGVSTIDLRPTNVVNLMDALRASLKGGGKGAAEPAKTGKAAKKPAKAKPAAKRKAG